MPFTTLFSTHCLSVDYDSHRNCLSLNLHGQLDTLSLQEVSLRLASVLCTYPTWCLVQDNIVPTRQGMEAEDSLLDQLLPAFHQIGIRHWTWVCGPTLRSQLLVEQVAKHLPQSALTIFTDLEHAATWLQQVS